MNRLATSVTSSGSGAGDGKSKVLAAVDIVELIGKTVALKRRGRKFLGLCPFHTEKTPSFNVDSAEQYFYCFGCKASGNAIDFVMKRDRLEFVDAMKQLAQEYNVELPRFGGSKQNTSERPLLLEAHSAACSLFEKLLADPQIGKAAREYLKSRGFTDESVKAFQIGYVPEGWDTLLASPLMRKFPPALLQLAGLAKRRENGNGHYDTFRNRLMFPIRDEAGRIIAFGGRVMPGSNDPAKYLNSPETPLFSKSKAIYGLDLARQKIVESRTVAVVEGYTDVVMAHQYGATNVVSILGTAMTPQHVTILRRFAERIVLLFDADTAGDVAVDRTVELFLTQPVEIAIAALPEGVDPDELLLERGPEGFEALLSAAQDALTYKWKQLARHFADGNDLTGRQKAVKDYLDLLASARGSGPIDPIRWGQALSRVSRLTDMPVEELNRLFRAKKPATGPKRNSEQREAFEAHDGVDEEPSAPLPTSSEMRAQRWILGALLNEPGRWSEVQKHVAVADFAADVRLRRIAAVYWSHQRDEGEPALNEFLSLLDDADKKLAIELAQEVESLADIERTLDGAISHLQRLRRREEQNKIVAESRNLGDEGDGNAANDLLRRLSEQKRQPDLGRA